MTEPAEPFPYQGGYCRACGMAQFKFRHQVECPHYDAEQARISLLVSEIILERDPARQQQLLGRLPDNQRATIETILVHRRGRRTER